MIRPIDSSKNTHQPVKTPREEKPSLGAHIQQMSKLIRSAIKSLEGRVDKDSPPIAEKVNKFKHLI